MIRGGKDWRKGYNLGQREEGGENVFHLPPSRKKRIRKGSSISYSRKGRKNGLDSYLLVGPGGDVEERREKSSRRKTLLILHQGRKKYSSFFLRHGERKKIINREEDLNI